MLIVSSAAYSVEEFPEGSAPNSIDIGGRKFLAVMTAYKQFKIDQEKADISKMTVSLMTYEDGNFVIMFGHWLTPEVGKDGAVIHHGYEYKSAYGTTVTYTVDATTNRIIKTTYSQ